MVQMNYQHANNNINKAKAVTLQHIILSLINTKYKCTFFDDSGSKIIMNHIDSDCQSIYKQHFMMDLRVISRLELED